MEEPLISVIVPVYKVEKYLNRCIESIVSQTYRNLEIILVDDGSPDNSRLICDEWTQKDERIRVIHKKNGGLSDARNVGMAMSTGIMIGFVDSDDWIAPQMYSRLYQAMKIDHSDIAACAVKMIWEDDSAPQMLTKSGNCCLNREEAMQALIEETWIKHPVWYKLYRADRIRNIMFPIGKCHEDTFWTYQVIGSVKSVSIIDYEGYYYWQRKGSIMGENYSIKRLDAIEALEERQDYLKNNFPSLAIRAQCDLWFACIYHGQKVLKNLSKIEKSEAVRYLNLVLNRRPFSSDMLRELRQKEIFWIKIAKLSLTATCKIRNILKIGL